MITILSITRSKNDPWIYLHCSNHCVIRMTETCLADLGWNTGTVIKK